MERRDSVEIKGKFLQGFKVTEILGESYEGIFVETWIFKAKETLTWERFHHKLPPEVNNLARILCRDTNRVQ